MLRVLRVLRGETRPMNRHLAILRVVSGGAKYAGAVARGETVSPELARSRVGACARCPAMTAAFVPAAGCAAVFCGPPLTDRLGRPGPTCGCLVGYVTRRDARGLGRLRTRAERERAARAHARVKKQMKKKEK